MSGRPDRVLARKADRPFDNQAGMSKQAGKGVQELIRLRPFKRADERLLKSWVRDQATVDLWRPARFSYPLTDQQLERYFDEFDEDERAWIMAALDDEGRMIGHFCMRLADYAEDTIRLGYIILDPDTRGKGCGYEMIGQALRYAREILGVKCVTLGVWADNLPARRCYERLGFSEVGRSEEDGRIYIEMEA